MKFIHQPYQPGETIAAIATPPGEGGVAIVRITGEQALDVTAKIFSGPVHTYQSHTAHFGQIHNLNGDPIDEVLLLVMKGKRSYSGETTVEIHCHGGSLVTRRVLEATIAAGARHALPGEFTFKAFMNGKIDLMQAEAVQELICAKSERALDAAGNQLKGTLSQKISSFQENLTQIAAILEAWVDFPEEGLEFATMEELCDQLEQVCQTMEKLAGTFHDGRILNEGISVCLVGCPNVGKSSLLNALLDHDRAIVSPIPGTTRDILEGQLRLNGLHLTLCDTAGIRESSEVIEQEGIRRSKEAMQKADLVLLVMDASRGLSEEDHGILDQVSSHNTILIWNKIDLPHTSLPAFSFPTVHLSAKNKQGITQLCETIDQVIWKKGPPSKEEVIITNARHHEALHKAIQAARRVIAGLQSSMSPEFLTIDMRQCLSELGKIIGSDISEDILSAIFSKFCIGK